MPSLMHLTDQLNEYLSLYIDTLVSPSTDTHPSVPSSTVGERLTAMLQKVPLTMHFEVDKGLCNVSLGHEKKRE